VTSSATASNTAQIALLHRISERDSTALSELYDAQSALLYSVALKILENEGEAEEVLQQVFVDVWDNVDSYDADLSVPFVWLMCITRELAIGRLRSRMMPIGQTGQHSDAGREKENDNLAARNGDAAFRSEEYPGFVDALAQLTQEQRSLIAHAYFRGRTQSELAQYFNLTLESVKNLIRSGMFALRIALEPSTARMHSLYLEELVAVNSLGALDGEDVTEFKRIVPNIIGMPNEIASYEHVAALFAVAHTQERIPHPTAKEKLLSRIR
jgi:RNA polymerase sigma factor (sigma-70 family)